MLYQHTIQWCLFLRISDWVVIVHDYAKLLSSHMEIVSSFLASQLMLVRMRSTAWRRPRDPAPASGYSAQKSSSC